MFICKFPLFVSKEFPLFFSKEFPLFFGKVFFGTFQGDTFGGRRECPGQKKKRQADFAGF